MTLEELIYKPTEVKVLGTSENSTAEREAMVGQVYEGTYSYLSESWSIYNEKNRKWYYFRKSDIQVMTPQEFKGERIGLGDDVDGQTVYGFFWQDGRYFLQVVRDNNFNEHCWKYCVSDITIHKPLHPSTPQIVEITLEEIAKLKGIPVEQLRIKE